MDDTVLAAIAKWPNVPAVYGWLGLSARGEWRLKGQPIGNAALREFIGRNYAADERGRWYFQNGPQRVFVELEAAPWIWRISSDGLQRQVLAHTGRAQGCCAAPGSTRTVGSICTPTSGSVWSSLEMRQPSSKV